MNKGPCNASWLDHHLQNDIMVDMMLSNINTEVNETHDCAPILNLRLNEVYGHPTGRLLSIAGLLVCCAVFLSETSSYLLTELT